MSVWAPQYHAAVAVPDFDLGFDWTSFYFKIAFFRVSILDSNVLEELVVVPERVPRQNNRISHVFIHRFILCARFQMNLLIFSIYYVLVALIYKWLITISPCRCSLGCRFRYMTLVWDYMCLKIQDKSIIISLLIVNCHNCFRYVSVIYCVDTLGANFDSCVGLSLGTVLRGSVELPLAGVHFFPMRTNTCLFMCLNSVRARRSGPLYDWQFTAN
jgi:hypothetical protein